MGSVFAAEHGKVPAICEYGVKGGVQNTAIADWHTRAFLKPVLGSAACRNISFAMTWRNTAPDSYWVPLPGNLTYPSFKELYESPHTLFAGDFGLVLPMTAFVPWSEGLEFVVVQIPRCREWT